MQHRRCAACADSGLRPLTRAAILAAGLIGTCLLSLSAMAAGHDIPLYKQPGAPLEQRLEDLLSRMTLAEKLVRFSASGTARRRS